MSYLRTSVENIRIRIAIYSFAFCVVFAIFFASTFTHTRIPEEETEPCKLYALSTSFTSTSDCYSFSQDPYGSGGSPLPALFCCEKPAKCVYTSMADFPIKCCKDGATQEDGQIICGHYMSSTRKTFMYMELAGAFVVGWFGVLIAMLFFVCFGIPKKDHVPLQ